MARSSAPEGLEYRPLEPPWDRALELFHFVGAASPPAARVECGWGAWTDERLGGALLVERAGGAAMLHGPAVLAPDQAPPESLLEVAARLVSEALAFAGAKGIGTVFARPQGLDRIWVRLGFIPVPEAELSQDLRGRPGTGLFGWRGGSALWSGAGRGGGRWAAGG